MRFPGVREIWAVIPWTRKEDADEEQCATMSAGRVRKRPYQKEVEDVGSELGSGG